MSVWKLVLAAAGFAWLAGCASYRPVSAPAPTGILVIAGGASSMDGPVWPRFAQEVEAARQRQGRPESRVVVLPTASKDPDYAQTFYPGAMAALSPTWQPSVERVHESAAGSAQDPAIAQRLAAAQGVWFTGGNQSRITQLLLGADGSEAAALTAVREALAKGAVIGGTSAGAAIMSHRMIGGGRSGQAARFGVGDEGVLLTDGLGFLPFGLVDQHFLARGRLGRLLVAMQDAEAELGFGIDENGAAVVTLGNTPKVEGVGLHSVCILQAQVLVDPAPNGGPWRARLHLLGHGDVWEWATQQATPRSDRRVVDASQPSPAVTAASDPWEEDAILHALIALSRNPGQAQVLQGPLATLTLSADERTRFRTTPFQGRDLFASDVIVHLQRRLVD